MTPVINSRTQHFEFGGVYNSLVLLRDRETGSLWDHITGKCVYGPLKGSQLPISNLLHMNVSQALAIYPDIQIAISNLELKPSKWSPQNEETATMTEGLRNTMGVEDRRRPTMDIGLGVWTGATHRYYPMENILAHDRAIIDELEGRQLLVYIEPSFNAPAALYTQATSCTWEGDELHLNTGEVIRSATLLDTNGERQDIQRPLQLFTRWYGFAITFPGCEIYTE